MILNSRLSLARASTAVGELGESGSVIGRGGVGEGGVEGRCGSVSITPTAGGGGVGKEIGDGGLGEGGVEGDVEVRQ